MFCGSLCLVVVTIGHLVRDRLEKIPRQAHWYASQRSWTPRSTPTRSQVAITTIVVFEFGKFTFVTLWCTMHRYDPRRAADAAIRTRYCLLGFHAL